MAEVSSQHWLGSDFGPKFGADEVKVLDIDIQVLRSMQRV